VKKIKIGYHLGKLEPKIELTFSNTV